MAIDPDLELHLREREDKILTKVQQLYAIKLIEKIVFAILGLFGVAVCMKIIAITGL